VVASKSDYEPIIELLKSQDGNTTIEQRKSFAAKAFLVVGHYDVAISNYFNPGNENHFLFSAGTPTIMRYGENPHQQGKYFGDLSRLFNQLNGKELSFNNLVDVDAAIQLIGEFNDEADATFAIIKHTNVCGIASRKTVETAWQDALAGDPESAFGGVLVCNKQIDKSTSEQINEIFFEVLIAPSFDSSALEVLTSKKNRILLEQKQFELNKSQFKSLLNGVLMQDTDEGNLDKWEESGGRNTTETEKSDLLFANKICKHLKSNAIALVKNKQLIGKGCGQTSRIDSLRQAIEKSKQFNFNLKGAVMASDAFFPFNDCVKMGHEEGVEAFIQPGGSIRDKDSIDYCKEKQIAMVITGMRHFKH
jgi:phosphoribosylaminoimidazolecarboxamide formyltransferase/IMP cyclohydrolase